VIADIFMANYCWNSPLLIYDDGDASSRTNSKAQAVKFITIIGIRNEEQIRMHIYMFLASVPKWKPTTFILG